MERPRASAALLLRGDGLSFVTAKANLLAVRVDALMFAAPGAEHIVEKSLDGTSDILHEGAARVGWQKQPALQRRCPVMCCGDIRRGTHPTREIRECDIGQLGCAVDVI